MEFLIFGDTETTGIEEEDRLVQLAFIHDDRTVNELFSPDIPIKFEAMAVHHVTRKMVKGKPRFKGSYYCDYLKKANEGGHVFVAHNAKFDLAMLAKEDVEFDSHIDTLKVVRYLDTEAKFANYQLQYLRYLFGIEIEAVAHDALGDVEVLRAVFLKLLERLMHVEGLDQEDAVERMIMISEEPTLIKKFAFGKHKGKLVEDVAINDIGYLKWLYREKLNEDQLDEDWIYTLEKYIT